MAAWWRRVWEYVGCARVRCVGERILGQRLQCETLRFRLGSLTRRSLPPRGNRLADGKATQIKSLLGLVLIILSERASEQSSAGGGWLPGRPAGRWDSESFLKVEVRGCERARLRRARRDDRDAGIGYPVQATEVDRATAQGVLGLREFSPSARTCRPKKNARPGRPDHLLFYHRLMLASGWVASGAAKEPRPVGRITCVSTMIIILVCWPLGEMPAKLPTSHDL